MTTRSKRFTPMPETERPSGSWGPESGTLPSARRPTLPPPPTSQTQMAGRAEPWPLPGQDGETGPSSAAAGPPSRPSGPPGPPVAPIDYGPRAGETAKAARRRRALLDAVVTAWRALRQAGVPNDVIVAALRPLTEWARRDAEA